jgi:hypothetical protein|tara:strand:+ start:1260 stop:1439 length:180 start_codon:yes stop_codon:yes gene_type:complete
MYGLTFAHTNWSTGLMPKNLITRQTSMQNVSWMVATMDGYGSDLTDSLFAMIIIDEHAE